MDNFMSGFGNIETFYRKDNEFYIKDSEGGLIEIIGGLVQDMEVERVDDMDKKREEMLVKLQEKLEVMNNAVSDLQYLVDEELHDGEKDENMDLKMIIKLNRINDELETCYDLIVEESL